MAGRYEPVSVRDVEDFDIETPVSPRHTLVQPYVGSPPSSVHSRSRSPHARHQVVDKNLEDAFGSDQDGDENDDNDEEHDARQRLMRRSEQIAESRSPPPSSLTVSALDANLPISVGPLGPIRSQTPSRIYGSGIQSDGVFSNLSARPESGSVALEKDEQPPTYEQAAADAAPPYWETTILTPGFGLLDEVYLDGLPVGSFFSFVWNAMISMSFFLVGFLLTYLLHSTHAAKNGSRAGLGITLIKYGFSLKTSGMDGPAGGPPPDGPDGYAAPADPNAHNFDPDAVGVGGGDGSMVDGILTSDFMAYLLMIVGWFILIRSISDYMQARRHKMLVLQSPDRNVGVAAIIAEGEQPATVV